MAGLVAAVSFGLILVACQPSSREPVEGVQEVVPTFDAVSASADAGDFSFELRAQTPAVQDTPFAVGAVLLYQGPKEFVVVGTTAGDPAFWELAQQNGSLLVQGPNPSVCQQVVFQKGKPYWLPYLKGASWDPSDPNAPFYESFTRSPEFSLPAGEWTVRAIFDMTLGGCNGQLTIDRTLELQISVAPGR